MKKIILITVLFFSLPIYSEETREVSEIRAMLKQRTLFEENEIENFIVLIQKAKTSSLPEKILINKIKEGIARKAEYKVLYGVVSKKYDLLLLSKEMLSEQYAKMIHVKDSNYSINMLSELIEKGLNKEEYKYACSIALQNKMNMEETLRICETILLLKEEKIEYAFIKEVIETVMKKKPDMGYLEYITKIIIEAKKMNIKQDEIREIVINGINKGRNINSLRESVREAASYGDLEIRQENKEKKGEISEELKKRQNDDKRKR